jgi:hypothetical protein
VSIEGTRELGPGNATLSVRTGRTGAVAKAGHDLLIVVDSWSGTLAPGLVELEADSGSLRVVEGTGGMQKLDDDDKAGIKQTIDEEVLQRGAIRFRSSEVSGDDGRYTVRGELTLGEVTHPIAFDLALADDGAVQASAAVKQSDWGIKPYTALFGALKVADEVQVLLEAPAESRVGNSASGH